MVIIFNRESDFIDAWLVIGLSDTIRYFLIRHQNSTVKQPVHQEAQALYRQFVHEGIGASPPYEGIKDRSVLRNQSFAETLKPVLRDKSTLEEAPKQERVAFRPPLEQLLSKEKHKDKGKRNKEILSAHPHHGYTLSEIGNFFGLHYTTISKIVKQGSL